jgi:type VI secretion system protein VasI
VLKIIAIALVLAANLHLSNVAAAGASDGLKKCAAIADSAKRIVCYDALASQYGTTPKASRDKKGTKWSVATEVSPITDSTDVFLQLRADNTIVTDVFGEAKPTFIVQCVNGKTSAAINWGFIIGGGKTPVTYRVDSQRAVVANVNISDNFRAIVSFNEKRLIKFLKLLLGKKKLAVQVNALSQGPVTTIFDVSDFDKAVVPLRQSCSW